MRVDLNVDGQTWGWKTGSLYRAMLKAGKKIQLHVHAFIQRGLEVVDDC